MSDEKKYGSLEDFAKEVWGKRAEGLPVPGLDINRPISESDVEYITNLYAFAQILDPDATSEESFARIEYITTQSGWTVLHYGTAMSTSPGKNLYGSQDRYTLDENGVYVPVNTGKGTIVKQIVDTGVEMVSLTQNPEIVKKPWKVIYIVAAQTHFAWSIWAAALEQGIEIQGLTRDTILSYEAKYKRLKAVFTSIIHPTPQPKVK